MGRLPKLKVGVQDAKVSTVKTDRKDTNPDTPTKTKCCRNCNRTGHTSHPAEMEASCPESAKNCDCCRKEGHFKACCESWKRQCTTNNEVAEGEAMSLVALAGIMMKMADVNMAVARYSGYKVPHMLYDQLKWIKQQKG